MEFFRLVALNLRAMDTRLIEFEGMSGINYHVNKKLVLKFNNIEAGGVELSPAGFLVEDPEDITLVEQKIFSRQSKERISMLYKNEKVSASMSDEEQVLFRELLDKENFISNHAEIIYNGERKDYFSLTLEEQKELIPIFNEFKIHQVVDLQDEELTFEDFKNEIYKKAYQQAQDKLKSNVNNFQSKHNGLKINKDKVKVKAAMAVGFGVLGGALEFIGKGMSKTKSVKMNILALPVRSAGKACSIISTANSASIARDLLGGEFV